MLYIYFRGINREEENKQNTGKCMNLLVTLVSVALFIYIVFIPLRKFFTFFTPVLLIGIVQSLTTSVSQTQILLTFTDIFFGRI